MRIPEKSGPRGEMHIAQIVHELERNRLLPAILFRTSRRQCDMDAERAGNQKNLRLSPPRQRELSVEIKRIISAYDMEADLILSHVQYSGLVASGIGAHHAGQLLMWRLLLEELMASGLLRVLVATGTVAAGVDFPARTVIITAHSKRGAEGFNTLTSAEFQQMSGRAGRRGKDTVGFCVATPNPFCDARELLKLSKRAAEPLRSAYFPSPSTVLNLLRYRNVDDLRYTVERSLASFVDRRDADILRKESEDLENRLPQHLRIKSLTADFDSDSDVFDNGMVLETSSDQTQGEITKAEKKHLKRIRQLKRKALNLEKRQVNLLDLALDGLRQLGYVEETSLSAKGYWAANLCTSLVLELAEIIESGLLNGVAKERLVAIVAAISGDPHRQYLKTKTPPISKEDESELKVILERVAATSMPGVSGSREVLSACANTVVVWMKSENWQAFRSILLLSGVAEGDAARLITQTAEHLNQLSRLMVTHPELAVYAEDAKRWILRPPLTEAINLETME